MKTIDDFIAEKRASCSPSLRMIGADDGEGWVLIRLLWTTEYWKERAEKAEAALKQIETYTRRQKKGEAFTLEKWLEAHQGRAEARKHR